jgi:hypothetical protein
METGNYDWGGWYVDTGEQKSHFRRGLGLQYKLNMEFGKWKLSYWGWEVETRKGG